MILDACCNERRWWPLAIGKHVGMDRDRQYAPDVVADFTAMPFRDGCFDEVWADPPHRRWVSASSWKTSRTKLNGPALYGGWSSWGEYGDTLRGLRSEALRILRPGGIFYLKLLVRDTPPDPQERVVTTKWVFAVLPSMKCLRRRRSQFAWSRCETLLLREAKQ